jgi:F-type H+-transporting ATPase subunit delta
MRNPRLAARYAKSLLDLANERNELERVYNDMLFLQSLCNQSREVVTLLRSPVITPDKKLAVLNALTKDRINESTKVFIRLLVNKAREESLPEIITAFIAQYKKQKDIHIIRLTTAMPASEELKNQIIGLVQSQTKMKNIELKTEVREDIIGGFLLEIGDTLVDASISYDLKAIRSQFLNNDFIYKIR